MKSDQLPSLIKAMTKEGVFVEIGSWEGDFSYELLTQTGCTKLYCVDPYKRFDLEDYKDGMNMLTQEQFDQKYAAVRERFNKFGNRVEFLRMTSSEAAALFQDESVDYVYIDGNHGYQYAEEDIRLWYPKVKKGGVLCGDDVYSNDLAEHDENKNVLRIWGRSKNGTPDCWGYYGTYTACMENERRLGIKFVFEQTQFSVVKN